MKRIFWFIPFVLAVSLAVALEPGQFFTSGPTTAKRIALTFDDGPGPYTDQFLDLLDRYQVKATFFVLGEQASYKPDLVKKIVEKGHEVGDHTYNHVNYKARYKKILEDLSKKGLGEKEALVAVKSELLNDMKKSHAIIAKASGVEIRLCRMPHGIDRPWIKEVAREMGYTLINWTYGADWNSDSAEKLLPGYLGALNPGTIYLFHDGGKNRSKSLVLTEAVLKAAQEQGFEVVPVGKLLSNPTK